jgi:hypothetical protein
VKKYTKFSAVISFFSDYKNHPSISVFLGKHFVFTDLEAVLHVMKVAINIPKISKNLGEAD